MSHYQEAEHLTVYVNEPKVFLQSGLLSVALTADQEPVLSCSCNNHSTPRKATRVTISGCQPRGYCHMGREGTHLFRPRCEVTEAMKPRRGWPDLAVAP